MNEPTKGDETADSLFFAPNDARNHISYHMPTPPKITQDTIVWPLLGNAEVLVTDTSTFVMDETKCFYSTVNVPQCDTIVIRNYTQIGWKLQFFYANRVVYTEYINSGQTLTYHFKRNTPIDYIRVYEGNAFPLLNVLPSDFHMIGYVSFVFNSIPLIRGVESGDIDFLTSQDIIPLSTALTYDSDTNYSTIVPQVDNNTSRTFKFSGWQNGYVTTIPGVAALANTLTLEMVKVSYNQQIALPAVAATATAPMRIELNPKYLHSITTSGVAGTAIGWSFIGTRHIWFDS